MNKLNLSNDLSPPTPNFPHISKPGTMILDATRLQSAQTTIYAF